MTDWFSERFREVISATDLKGLMTGPWKLKVAALGLAFLLWILVRLSTQAGIPVSVEQEKNTRSTVIAMGYEESNGFLPMVQ